MTTPKPNYLLTYLRFLLTDLIDKRTHFTPFDTVSQITIAATVMTWRY